MKKTITNRLKTVALSLVLLSSTASYAQNNVGINTSSPNPSAALDVTSSTQGVLVPRMLSSDRSAITSPATGLLVYQTDGTAGFYYYNGSAWVALGSGGSATTDASLLTAGTLADARLSSNVTLKGNTFNTANNLVSLNGSTQLPAVSGVNLTNLNASNLASGTVPLARLGASGTPSASTFLRGDNTWATPSGGGGGAFPLFFERTSSLSITSTTTFTDAVSVDLAAGKTYYIEGLLYGVRSGATSGASNTRITYTGSATTQIGVNAGNLLPGTTFSSTSFDYEATLAVSNSTYTATLGPKNGFNCYVTTTTAGTFALKIAKGTLSATSTGDFTVREGSWIKATPLD